MSQKLTMLYLGTDGLLHSWTGLIITPPPPFPPAGGQPTARITLSAKTGLSVSVSGTTSSEGTTGVHLTGYLWDFGDGATATTTTPTHAYAVAGTYTIKLTVTDSVGVSNSTTLVVSVAAPNQPPVVAFSSFSSSGLVFSGSVSGSYDPDGSIQTTQWDFGDGGGASGPTVTHTYAKTGNYTVKATCTDNLGGSTTISQVITITTVNQAPTAVLTVSTSGMVGSYDARASSDPEGGPLTYDVDWGDGSAHSSGSTNSHTYTALGPWTVTLVVTDTQGATGTATATATPQSSGGPSGASWVPFSSLTGSDLTAKIAAATSGKGVSFDVGTYQFVPFVYYGSNPSGSSTGGYFDGVVVGSRCLAIGGAGIDRTIFSPVPNTSSRTLTPQTSDGSGSGMYSTSGSTNQGYLMQLIGNNQTLQDFTLAGTAQSSSPYWNGLRVSGQNQQVLRVKLSNAGPGFNNNPPGETFGIAATGATNIVMTDVEVDGANTGGSGIGINSSNGGTFTRVSSHGNKYSLGFAFYKHTIGATLTDCSVYANHGGINFEETSGTFEVVRQRFGTGLAADISGGARASYVTASAPFQVNIRDPRDQNGNSLIGVRKLNVNFWANEGTGYPSVYGRSNVKVFDAAGNDVTSSMLNFLSVGGGSA